MGAQGCRGKRVQGYRGTPAHAPQGGMGAPGGKVRGCIQYGVGGRRGAGVKGCLGNRALARKGKRVCVHRDAARSTTGAQKCTCFFSEKTSAFDRKMNPDGPGWCSGRVCIGFCRQSWLPLPDWGPATPARVFFPKQKLCAHGRSGVQQGEGHPFPKKPNNIFSPFQPGLQQERPH